MKNTCKPQFSIARPQPTTAKMISKSKSCNRHGVGLRVIEIHAHINKCGAVICYSISANGFVEKEPEETPNKFVRPSRKLHVIYLYKNES